LKAAAAEACQQPVDLVAVWGNATDSELAAGLTAIGLDAILRVMPGWKSEIARRVTDRLSAQQISIFDALNWWNRASNDERQQFLQNVGLSGVLAAIPASWGSPTEATFAGNPSAARLVDVLQYRLERDGINASVQLRKIREHINRKPPQMTIDLKAAPAAGKA